MKYFVAYLLKRDAAEYHRALTRELSSRFHIEPLHQRVDPHITIKNFEANEYEIGAVEQVLTHFSSRAAAQHFTIESFGRFGFKTVFLDVSKGNGALTLARECIAELNALPWMKPARHEGEKLHASVARFMTYKQFRRVWRFVKRERVRFRETLDSFAILKKEEPNSPWRLHREFFFLQPQLTLPHIHRPLTESLVHS